MNSVVYVVNGYGIEDLKNFYKPSRIIFTGSSEACNKYKEAHEKEWTETDFETGFKQWLEVGTEESFSKRKAELESLEDKLECESLLWEVCDNCN